MRNQETVSESDDENGNIPTPKNIKSSKTAEAISLTKISNVGQIVKQSQTKWENNLIKLKLCKYDDSFPILFVLRNWFYNLILY